MDLRADSFRIDILARQGVAGDLELNLPDGLHPEGEGHRLIAETAWTGLEPLLRKADRRAQRL
jgi:lysophospholipase L1-like esterase